MSPLVSALEPVSGDASIDAAPDVADRPRLAGTSRTDPPAAAVTVAAPACAPFPIATSLSSLSSPATLLNKGISELAAINTGCAPDADALVLPLLLLP